MLLPIAAWATAAQLAATSADLRQVLSAADGRARVLVADALPPLLWVLAATAVTLLGNAVPDAHPAPLTDRLLGGLLHVLCGAVGASLASGRLGWLSPAGRVLSTWVRARPPARSSPVGRSSARSW